MSRSLVPAKSPSLASRGQRSYALAMPPRAVLELLGAPSNPPVLSPEEARQRARRGPFTVLGDGRFTIYSPWRSTGDITPEGAVGGDIAVGPAVTGRVVPTPRGSRIDVRVIEFAPDPARRLQVALAALGWSAFVIAPIALGGAHPAALGLSGLSFFGGLASLLLYRRRERSQEIRDLLAIVERTFGPLELAAGDEAPHRRDEPDQVES